MKAIKIEKLKTIILTILVILSIALTYRLWFNDHNLFSISSVFQSNKIVKSQNGLEHVYSPPKIWVNLGEKSHVVITSKYQEYAPLRKECINLLKQALNSSKYETLSLDEWNGLISSKSVLFGYETPINTEILVKILNISNTNIVGSIPSIKDLIVVQDKMVSENIRFYIKDEAGGKIYLIKFAYDDNNLTALLNGIESIEQGDYVTGYELKYNLIKDDVLLSISEEEQTAKQIKFSNEFDLDSAIETKELVQNFFGNTNIVKNIEYRDDSKTRIIQKEFDYRKRILRIFENGQIEYTSAEISNDKVQYDLFASLKKAVDFIDNNLGFPENAYISDIQTVAPSDYIFCFDYNIEGLNVKQGSKSQIKNAIQIEVKGDLISSYKRNIKNYAVGKEINLNVGNLEAVGNANTLYHNQQEQKDTAKSVEKISLVYIDEGAGKYIYPYWDIKIDGKDFFINTVNKEN